MSCNVCCFFRYLPQVPVLSLQQVSGKHNLSKSLLMITQSTDNRSEKIFLGSQREQCSPWYSICCPC
jgi:hypothetical protein